MPISNRRRKGNQPTEKLIAKRQAIDASTADLYEDFQPSFEWKEEPENNILVVHLPYFTKDQLHISFVRSSRVVRVSGERQLTNNKRRRFNLAFQIPENCKVDKIHSKRHNNGNLTITMPKETITQPVVRKEEAKTTQKAPKAAYEPKSPKDHQQAAPSAKAADNEAKSLKDNEQVASPKAAAEEANFSKDMAAPGRAAVSSFIEKKTDGKSIDDLSAQKSEKEAKLKKRDHQDESTYTKAASTSTSTMKPTDKGSLAPEAENVDKMREKERREGTENIFTESKKPENVTEKTTQVRESALPKTTEEKQKEKKSVTAAAMEAVKGLGMEQNEDKQLMTGIGVAALVLVALGAYVSYSFGLKSKE